MVPLRNLLPLSHQSHPRVTDSTVFSMNLLKIHNHHTSFSLNSYTRPLSPPRCLSIVCFSPAPFLPPFPVLSLPKRKFPIYRVSGTKPLLWSNEEKEEEFEDLAPTSLVYQKTLRLVECSMFAAVAGLAYFLSNSLAIENYFACFFSLPIVISSMRWGVGAGRKTMVATTMLLFVLSGPVKASTYLLLHGLVGLTLGSLWRLGANWGLSIFLCTFVRAMGAMGYVLITSFLIRENILALITLNVHASITYMFTAIGVNTIPSMDLMYAIFGTVTWDEGFTKHTKMAGEGIVILIQKMSHNDHQ